jgi:hypothetical protein
METVTEPDTESLATAGPINLQAELLQLAATLMDVLLLHLALNMFTGIHTYFALWPLVALAVGSHVLAALLESHDIPGPQFELILGGAAVGSFLLAAWSQFFSEYALSDLAWIGAVFGAILGFHYPIGPLVGLIIVSGYLWHRAINAETTRAPNVRTRFELGLVLLVLLGVLRLLDIGAEMSGPVNRAIFWFFLLGMLALALRRAQIAGAHGHSVLGTRWFMLSMGVVGGLLLLGALLAGVFSRDLSEALFGPVLTGLALVGLALYTVFTWIVQAVFLILTPLFNFIWSIAGDSPPPRFQQPTWLQELQRRQQNMDVSGPVDILLPLSGLMVVLLVLFLLWLYWSPVRRRRREIQSEVRESVWDWRMVPQALAGLFRGRERLEPEADPLDALGRDARYRHTVQVRQIYRQVLDLAAARGAPRPLPQTADELLPALERVLPGDPVPLRTITAVYDAVRYRTDPATAAEAAAATAAWQLIATRAAPPK